MKALVFSFVLLFCGIAVHSQSTWQEYSQSNGIKFSTQDGSCTWEQSPAIQYKFIKIENLTTNRARITYQLEIHYGNDCNGCNGSAEQLSVITLEPGAQVVGTCNNTIPARLDILVSNPNLPALQFTQFNITNITIDWIE